MNPVSLYCLLSVALHYVYFNVWPKQQKSGHHWAWQCIKKCPAAYSPYACVIVDVWDDSVSVWLFFFTSVSGCSEAYTLLHTDLWRRF